MAARVRLPGSLSSTHSARTSCGPAAVPAPSADAGPVRCTHRASRVHVRPAVPHRGGARLVRRRCGPCLPAAALPDDLGNRDGHHRGRPPARLGGGRRRIAVDHQRDGGAADRLGRQDRDRCPGPERRRSCRRQTSRCSIWRRAPSPGSSGTVFRAVFRVPSPGSGAVRVHSKSTSPSTAVCPGRTRTRAGQAPCTWPGATPNLPQPSGISTRDACPSGRSCLVGQQYLADPQRSVGNIHPVWSYAHVPNGYTGDATEAIIAQIERFAPVSGNASSARQFARRRRWPPTTSTMSAATS